MNLVNPALTAPKSLCPSGFFLCLFLAATKLNHELAAYIAILNAKTLEALLEGHPGTEENIYYFCDRSDSQPISCLVLIFCFGGYL